MNVKRYVSVLNLWFRQRSVQHAFQSENMFYLSIKSIIYTMIEASSVQQSNFSVTFYTFV